MAGERNYLDPQDDTPGRDRAWSAILWGLMIAVGFIVWELTDRTGLAASVACLKFGWDDTATGLYLLRKDPDRSRGWACCTFHLARGCAKFGWIAFGVSWLAEEGQHLAHKMQGLPPAAVDNIFLNVLLLGLCGITTWMFLSGVATYLAFSGRKRVWIDPTTRDSRRHGLWPPQPWGKNRVRFNTVLGTVSLSHAFGFFPLSVAVGWRLLLLTIPFAVVLGWRVAHRIEARIPEECWPELLAEPVEAECLEAKAAEPMASGA